MTRPFLGYGRQSIDDDDIQSVVDVLRGDFLTQGPLVERFEEALADYAGATYAVAVSSGTAALHIAALAAEIHAGNIGLTSAVTFAASANCIRYAGGTVRFIDIDQQSLNISVEGLAAALEAAPDTKAVIPVHLAGLAEASSEIRRMAGRRVVIEDAAHSFGGEYACGRKVGCCAYSDMTILSFHPVKAMTTGEGGAVLTNDEALAGRLRRLRSHGIERAAASLSQESAYENGALKPWYYEQQELGFNYRLTDIQAGLGLSQLKKLDRFVERRRAIAARYDQAFSGVNVIRIPQALPEQRARSAHHLYPIVLDFEAIGITRTGLMNRLRAAGIGTQVHYIPVYRLPYYAGINASDAGCIEAERYYEGCLSIPMHPGLTDEDVDYVAGTILQEIARP